MKNSLLPIYVIVFVIYFAAPRQSISQTCSDTYLASTAYCVAEQQVRDSAIGVTYQLEHDRIIEVYQQALAAHLAAWYEAESDARRILVEKVGDPNHDPDTPEGHGTCGEAAVSGYEAADADFNSDLSDCLEAYPDENDYCIC